jgi:hypothetical protein
MNVNNRINQIPAQYRTPRELMKILLQHRRTLQYVKTADAWTKDDGDAHNFAHSQRAIAFAHDHDLTDVYVTVKFPDDDSGTSVPVPMKPLLHRSRVAL